MHWLPADSERRSETPQTDRLALSRQSILFLLACIRNPRCTKACQSPQPRPPSRPRVGFLHSLRLSSLCGQGFQGETNACQYRAGPRRIPARHHSPTAACQPTHPPCLPALLAPGRVARSVRAPSKSAAEGCLDQLHKALVLRLACLDASACFGLAACVLLLVWGVSAARRIYWLNAFPAIVLAAYILQAVLPDALRGLRVLRGSGQAESDPQRPCSHGAGERRLTPGPRIAKVPCT